MKTIERETTPDEEPGNLVGTGDRSLLIVDDDAVFLQRSPARWRRAAIS